MLFLSHSELEGASLYSSVISLRWSGYFSRGNYSTPCATHETEKEFVETANNAAVISGRRNHNVVCVVNIMCYDRCGHWVNKQSTLIVSPEPMTISFLVLGILALGVMRRRIRQ